MERGAPKKPGAGMTSPRLFLLPLGLTKPLVLPGVNKEALAKEKSKKYRSSYKEKERYEDSERKTGIFVKSVPLAECYEIPKRTGLPVAGQTMR